ncbi:MAG: ATP-binding protein, partial [Chloroflexota bacterium]
FVRDDTIIAVVADGQVIAAQGGGLDERMLTEQLAEPMAQAMSGAVGRGEFQFADGTRHLAAYSPVPGANWAVLVTHPIPSAYQANRALLERGLLALGLATLATLALVLLLGEWIARPIRTLTERAEAVNAGDLAPFPVPDGAEEIEELGSAIQRLSGTIAQQADDLDRARVDGEAQAAQLRELNRRTVRMQEDERRRLAGDIHDAVAPLITGALFQTRARQLHAQAADGSGNGHRQLDDEQQAELASINDLLGRATDELHNVVFALRPPDLDDIGVVAAIERHMADVSRSGLHCELDVIGDPPVLTPEVRLALYRIAQEALHNSLRHSSADQATVAFETTDYGLRMTIHDNGAGFDPESPGPATGLGLLSMRERASFIGATCTIASRPGDGTTIVIERPNELPILELSATAGNGSADAEGGNRGPSK